MNVDEIRPQLVCEVLDPEFGALGYLVVDRVLGDEAVGGIRLAPDVTVEEVAYLARAMTLKCSFLNFSTGGAKAGIAVPEPLITARRHEILAAFGRSLGTLLRTGIYNAGVDLGTTAEDIDVIRRAAGLPDVSSRIDGGHYTASTVVEAIRQAVATTDRGTVAGATIAIEGFGRVGAEVAAILAGEGARVVAVSTREGAIYDSGGLDVEKLTAARTIRGDRFVIGYGGAENLDLAELLLLDVDILVPCARAWTISRQNAGRVRARIVVPGANIPVTPSAERVLFDRGILYVPDFVANCGGVLAGSMATQGLQRGDIEHVVRREFASKVVRVLEEAKMRNAMPGEVAREQAWRNFRRMKRQLEHRKGGIRGLLQRARREGLRASLEAGASLLYRHRLVRWEWIHRLALRYTTGALCVDETLP